jgi:voltage-gated potassium channel
LILLVCMLALVIIRPLTIDYVNGTAVEVAAGLVVVMFLALSRQKRALVICAALILGAIILSAALYATWATASQVQSTLLSAGSIVLTIVFLCYVVWVILHDIFTDPARSWDNVNGALSVYLLTGYVFANLYLVISLANPEAFDMKRSGALSPDPGALMHRSSDFIYYSFVTLSTLGFGDIAPVAPLARTLSWLEAVSGQLYLAVLVARLIAVQGPRRAADNQ